MADTNHEQANKMLADIQKYHTDHSAEWNDDHEAKWKQMNAEYDAKRSESAREERLAELENKRQDDIEARTAFVADTESPRESATTAKPTARQHQLAMQSWFKDQRELPLTNEERQACEVTGLNPKAKELRFHLMTTPYDNVRALFGRSRPEMRADQVTGAVAANLGAEFVPEGFIPRVEESMVAFGNVRGVADVIRTATGNDLPWPTTNDSSQTGELLAEAAEVASQDVATAAITLKAYKYSSKLVTVSAELLEDSAINVPGLLGTQLGTRIARITNTHFTTGDNSSKPQGCNAGASTGVTAVGTATVTFDELIDLMHSVDPAYRGAGMGTGFMMSDATAAIVRKLKDGNANFLWQPSVVLGQPDTIYNFPVNINQQMPAMTTGLKPITFGAFQKYIVRDVSEFRLFRLDERYREFDLTGFVAFSRHDARILDAGTDPLKNLLMA